MSSTKSINYFLLEEGMFKLKKFIPDIFSRMNLRRRKGQKLNTSKEVLVTWNVYTLIYRDQIPTSEYTKIERKTFIDTLLKSVLFSLHRKSINALFHLSYISGWYCAMMKFEGLFGFSCSADSLWENMSIQNL